MHRPATFIDQKDQWITLLTPRSDFLGIFISRQWIDEWFEEYGGNHMGSLDTHAILVESPEDFTTLGERCLTLSLIRHDGDDIVPESWHFTLSHQSFFLDSLDEWECKVPDVSIPMVDVQCNRERETGAPWAGRDMFKEIREMFGLEDNPPDD